ncbi:MAG: ABC transporter ATP-binding protein [Phycisphaerales bacterium]|jgi:putative ABC transport system ATP-binding protein|nr:ABC transporter ATP-binding protein [Phycisphaerales bacterium]
MTTPSSAQSSDLTSGAPDATDATADGAIVRTENLTKTYQMGPSELTVLREVSIDIKQGEYIAIMGPSGSGKSTLLNLLGCLDRPTTGRYLLGGQDISLVDDDELSAIRGAKIGFIFQSYNLIHQLNIIENIEVPMIYQNFSESASEARARELAELVGLGDRLRHRTTELSGGQQQRVAIARALANDPLIILGDEPTGNLDSKSGKEILDLLDSLHQQGKTLIIVTHDDDVSLRAQRVFHVLDGRIERIDVHDN